MMVRIEKARIGDWYAPMIQRVLSVEPAGPDDSGYWTEFNGKLWMIPKQCAVEVHQWLITIRVWDQLQARMITFIGTEVEAARLALQQRPPLVEVYLGMRAVDTDPLSSGWPTPHSHP